MDWIGLCFENTVPLSLSLSLSFSPSFPFLSPFLFLFLYFSFCFFLSFPLFLSPHRQVTIESDPNMEKLPGFRFTQSISPIFFVLTLFLRLRVTYNITNNCRKLLVLFLICYASEPLTLQLHQDCIKVVRSNGVVRKRPARGHWNIKVSSQHSKIFVRSFVQFFFGFCFVMPPHC